MKEKVTRHRRAREAPAPAAPELHAETRWFHVLRAMIDSGDLAKMDGSTVKVYIVTKAYTNLETGAAFPGVETIAKKAGLSRAQVWRALQQLDELGYVTKTKHGRHNVYQLRENVVITDGNGQGVARASWDYIPVLVQTAVTDIRQVLLSGDLAGAKVVKIEHLAIQINVNEMQPGATANNIVITQGESLEKIKDPELRALVAGAASKGLTDER